MGTSFLVHVIPVICLLFHETSAFSRVRFNVSVDGVDKTKEFWPPQPDLEREPAQEFTKMIQRRATNSTVKFDRAGKTCVEDLASIHKTRRFAVSVFEGQELKLTCYYCHDDQSQRLQGMLWFRIGHLNEQAHGYPVTQVQVDMHDIEMFNRVTVTADHTLVVKSSAREDAGAYFCQNTNDVTLDHIHGAEVDHIMTSSDTFKVLFHVDVLPINNENLKVVKSSGQGFPKPSVTDWLDDKNLKVFTAWEDWGKCEVCGTISERQRIGWCMVQKIYSDVPLTSWHLEEAMTFYPAGVPCHSSLLADLPEAVKRYDEVEYESCALPCHPKGGNKVQFRSEEKTKTGSVQKAKKVYHETLEKEIGQELLLHCPGAHIDTPVAWANGSKYISALELHRHTKGRVEVDVMHALHFKLLKPEDAGTYYCWYHGKKKAGFGLTVTGTLDRDDIWINVTYVLMSFIVDFIIFLTISVIRHRNRPIQQKVLSYSSLYSESSSDITSLDSSSSDSGSTTDTTEITSGTTTSDTTSDIESSDMSLKKRKSTSSSISVSSSGGPSGSTFSDTSSTPLSTLSDDKKTTKLEKSDSDVSMLSVGVVTKQPKPSKIALVYSSSESLDKSDSSLSVVPSPTVSLVSSSHSHSLESVPSMMDMVTQKTSSHLAGSKQSSSSRISFSDLAESKESNSPSHIKVIPSRGDSFFSAISWSGQSFYSAISYDSREGVPDPEDSVAKSPAQKMKATSDQSRRVHVKTPVQPRDMQVSQSKSSTPSDADSMLSSDKTPSVESSSSGQQESAKIMPLPETPGPYVRDNNDSLETINDGKVSSGSTASSSSFAGSYSADDPQTKEKTKPHNSDDTPTSSRAKREKPDQGDDDTLTSSDSVEFSSSSSSSPSSSPKNTNNSAKGSKPKGSKPTPTATTSKTQKSQKPSPSSAKQSKRQPSQKSSTPAPSPPPKPPGNATSKSVKFKEQSAKRYNDERVAPSTSSSNSPNKSKSPSPSSDKQSKRQQSPKSSVSSSSRESATSKSSKDREKSDKNKEKSATDKMKSYQDKEKSAKDKEKRAKDKVKSDKRKEKGASDNEKSARNKEQRDSDEEQSYRDGEKSSEGDEQSSKYDNKSATDKEKSDKRKEKGTKNKTQTGKDEEQSSKDEEPSSENEEQSTQEEEQRDRSKKKRGKDGKRRKEERAKLGQSAADQFPQGASSSGIFQVSWSSSCNSLDEIPGQAARSNGLRRYFTIPFRSTSSPSSNEIRVVFRQDDRSSIIGFDRNTSGGTLYHSLSDLPFRDPRPAHTDRTASQSVPFGNIDDFV